MDTLNQNNNSFKDGILKKSTILYLEDEDIIRSETISIFEKFFKKVLTATNGEEGLSLYQTHKDEIDIVLTDINMPKMNGIEFMAAIRKETYELPILIVTAFNDVDVLGKAIKLNVADYIVKPMQMNSTLKIFDKILTDIHNKKVVEKQKHELEIYKDILDNENLVSETDLKGIITYANDIFCEVSGYTREELVGANHNIVRHPDVSPKVYEELWETIQSKQIWTGKIKNKTKDGSAYYVRSTIFPILDENGEIEKYVASRFLMTEEEEEKHKLKKYIMHQKSNQVRYEKELQDKYDDALNVAKLQKEEQFGKFIHELNEQIKNLRAKNSDDKGRIINLENQLKTTVNKLEELQISYQARTEKLHTTAVVAVEKFNKINKKNILITEKLQKSQEAIITLQGYIDEYRARIQELEDLTDAYQAQFGHITVR